MDRLTIPTNSLPVLHILTKPTGAVCNLHCSYCFFLDKESLYPDSPSHLGDEVFSHCILSQPSLAERRADSEREWHWHEIKTSHLMRAIIVSGPMTMTKQ